MNKPLPEPINRYSIQIQLDQIANLMARIRLELEICKISELPKAITEIKSLSKFAEVKINEIKAQIPPDQ